jgi:hypothetical protein
MSYGRPRSAVPIASAGTISAPATARGEQGTVNSEQGPALSGQVTLEPASLIPVDLTVPSGKVLALTADASFNNVTNYGTIIVDTDVTMRVWGTLQNIGDIYNKGVILV